MTCLGGFFLELSVDNKTLKECSEPADKRTTTTGVSYVLDKNTNERIVSDQTFYSVVNQVDKIYEVHFGASKELLSTPGQPRPGVSYKAKIYIDGRWDGSWRLINKSTKLKKVGFNISKKKKSPLTFDLSKWEEDGDQRIEKENDVQDDVNAMQVDIDHPMNDNNDASNNEKNPEGQYGAISIYIFNTNDIEKNESANGPPLPLAALHIHYRPKQWLLARNILFEEMLSEITDNTQESSHVHETPQENIQETQKVKTEPKKKVNFTRNGINRKERERGTQAATIVVEEPAGDTDMIEIVEDEAIEEVQVAKKRSSGRKAKKSVEKTKETLETSTRRYNLRARK
ncbi:11868_t:CDS:2 [Funneliformis caledonium]|uniref:11868_t:CDS:1 n=1 Tax=Funneliformis caledonium TaxID=1117310 RepID=A0A9N9GVS8_9GLOM|nr:11868_t:CDS:2 [Funneliformis caledonium]